MEKPIKGTRSMWTLRLVLSTLPTPSSVEVGMQLNYKLILVGGLRGYRLILFSRKTDLGTGFLQLVSSSKILSALLSQFPLAPCWLTPGPGDFGDP